MGDYGTIDDEERLCREPWGMRTRTSETLYDRVDQQGQLQVAYERCCLQTYCGKREIVMISGPSGAGKTVLAMRFKETIVQEGGWFVSGKFDQLAAKYHATTKPYRPFVAAFTELCDRILAAGGDELASIKLSLQNAMSDVELAMLEDFIPALVKVLGSQSSSSHSRRATRGIDAENNFVDVVCRFVEIICSSGQKPVVLFLDDIQWADPKSFDLLKELTVAEKMQSGTKLMLLCTFRDGDSSSNALTKRSMEDEGLLITDIQVGNISETAVNAMVSSLLQTPSKDCKSLSDVVYQTTAGNVFFVIQLIESLRDDELLTLDESGQWNWDEMHILGAVESQSVLQLLVKKVEKLPKNAIGMLKIASCLGVVFEETTVWCAGTLARAESAKALQQAKEKGLILFDEDLGNWKFVHDKVQQAVYSLIPASEQQSFHLNIGKKLSPGLPVEVEDEDILLVADQISRGIELVDDPYEKIEFAQLYLRAGKKAALSSAFSSAAAFLELGISLLSDRSWTENYALTLSLYNTAAEIEYYNCNFGRVDSLVAEVLERGRCFEDTLRAHFARIYSLGTRGEMLAACDEGFAVLKKLGEHFPRKVTMFNRSAAILSFQRSIRGKKNLDILKLPVMDDAMALTALRMMLVVSSFAFYVQKEAVMLLTLRVVTRTLQRGLSDMSSVGFGALSVALAMKGEIKSASRYGNLASQLFDKYDSKEWQARVFALVYGGYYHLEHHYRDSLQPLLAGHRSGLVLGDIQFSMVCTVLYSGIAIECGTNLPQLATKIASFRDLSMRYRLYLVLGLGVLLQTVLNFMGKSDDPLVLTGDVLNEDEAFNEAKSKNQVALLLMLLHKQSLAIYMDNMPAAQTMSAQLLRLKRCHLYPFLRTKFAFQEAFVAARLARTCKRQRTIANNALSKLREYAEGCPQNYQHQVDLIEAELAASTGKSDEALKKYEQSIERATEHSFVHEQGLACERLGHLLRDLGRLDEGREYFRQASSCYSTWGAQIKVDHLAKEV